MVKLLYLVRHAQSVGNRDEICQGPDSALSEQGYEQARILAHRCKELLPSVVLCSPLLRARQTADVIMEHLGEETPLEFSPLLEERRRAREVVGKPKTDPMVQRVDACIAQHFHDPNFRFSTEENLFDLAERAYAALALLTHRKESRVVVITHGHFMRMLVGRAIFDDLLPAECWRRMKRFRIQNTGITTLQYHDDSTEKWSMTTWGDVSHLGQK